MTPDFVETHTAKVKDVELLTGLRFYSDVEQYESIRARTFIISVKEVFSQWRLQHSM